MSRRWLSAAVVCAVACITQLVDASFAYWSLTDSSMPGGAIAGAIGAAAAPTASVSGRDVTLAWGAASNATGYAVARAGFSSSVGGTCSGTVSATACTDTSLPENGGSSTAYTYTDTGKLYNWTGPTSAASATVTIPAPALTLTTTTYSTGVAATSSATVTSFFDSEGVTFCLDQSTLPCSTQLNSSSVTVPATGGTTTTSLNMPALSTAGTHTVYAIGTAGSVATASITVNQSPRRP